MSNRSRQGANSNKNPQSKITNQEQIAAGLVAVGIDGLVPQLTKDTIPALSKKKSLEELAREENSEVLENVVAEGATEAAVDAELAAVTDEAIGLALVDDAEYSVTANKDDDDDGAWWWLKGLALIGGVALLAGGGGSSAPAVESYDHLSFIDEESDAEDGDDVLVMTTSRSIANLTLVAPENEQTEDTGEDGLFDDVANTQYIFVDEESGVRTLNLRVSDEDNIALGLFLDNTLDESGGVVDAVSQLETLSILVDDNSILSTGSDYEYSGGDIGAEDLIYSEVSGRSFSIEVQDSSELYADYHVLHSGNSGGLADDVTVEVLASGNSTLESGYEFIYNHGNSFDVTVDLTDSSLFSGTVDDDGSIIESYGDDLSVEITLDNSTMNAGGSGGSDSDIVYSEGDRADISIAATNNSVIESSYSTVESYGDDVAIHIDLTDSSLYAGEGNDGSVIESYGDAADLDLHATDSFIGADWLVYAEDNDGSTNIDVELTRTDVELGEMGIEAYGDDLTVNLTATGDVSGGNYFTVDDGSYSESADVIYVNGSNSTVTVDMTDYSVTSLESGGYSGGYFYENAGADDFIRVDAHLQSDEEETLVDVTLTESELVLDDDLIDFNGEKVNVDLAVDGTFISMRDSLLEVDSSNNQVVASLEITNESEVATEYGHIVDIRDANTLDLSLVIEDSLVGNALGYADDGFFGIGGINEIISDLDYLRDVSIVNVDGGLLSSMDIDFDATSSILISDQNYIHVASNQRPEDAESTVHLALDSMFAFTADDAVAIEKNDTDVSIDLTYASGYVFAPEDYSFSVTYTGDDFLDLVGDNSVVDISIADGSLTDIAVEGYQVHFVADDFVDLLGSDAAVSFDIQDNSVIVLGTGTGDEGDTPRLMDIDGSRNHTVNITMANFSAITNGEDFGSSGGFFGVSGGDDTFGLVRIENEQDDNIWDGTSNASVTVTLSDDAEIDAVADYYYSGGSVDLIEVDSSNAFVSVTLNDDSNITASGDLIFVNTNLYNSEAYRNGSSEISLTVNDTADVISDNESLIYVEFENQYYVGEDLADNYDGLGLPADVSINLTLDGGESGGVYAYAEDNLVEIDDDDGLEDQDNVFTAAELNRDVRVNLSNAYAETNNSSIELDDLLGFDVRLTLDSDSYLESDTHSIINADNLAHSYIEIKAQDSEIYLDDYDYEDALLFLEDSNDITVNIDLEDTVLGQFEYYNDGMAIFTGEDSDNLNVNIRLENISGEDELQVLDLEGVNDSTFNVTFYESLEDTNDLYFDIGETGWDYVYGDRASTNNELNLSLVDTTDSGDLDDVYINTAGFAGYYSYGSFNTVNLDLDEIDLDEVYVDQDFTTSGGYYSGGDYLMTTTLDLEGSSIDYLYASFDEDESGGYYSGGYGEAELYINLNDSEINSANLDVWDLDNVDLYTQGTNSSFIQLDVDLMSAVDTLNVYSLGSPNFDYQINYSAVGDDWDLYDGDWSSNSEGFMTEINLADDRDGGARNYDYLSIENIEMTQVYNFETSSARDKIYNEGDFNVQNLSVSYTGSNNIGNSYVFLVGYTNNTDNEQWYIDTQTSAGLVDTSDALMDTYYFASGYSDVNLLIEMLNSDDTDTDDQGGNNIRSLGERLDNSNGNGNTYYVMNVSGDLEIYRWDNDGVDFTENDALYHVMTINGVGTSVDSASELYGIISTNQYHTVI